MTTTMVRPPEQVAGRPRSKREIYTAMSGLLIAMLLAMLDNLIVGTAMPTIVGELGGLAHLSWVVTAYTLATAVSTRYGPSSVTCSAASPSSWHPSPCSSSAPLWPASRITW